MFRVVLLAALLTSQTEARSEAGRAFERGATAFNAGDFPAAIGHFSEAYRLYADAKILFNLALAYDKNGQKKEALAHYRKFDEEMATASPSDVAGLAGTLAGARARIATLEEALRTTTATGAPDQPPSTTTDATPADPPPGPGAGVGQTATLPPGSERFAAAAAEGSPPPKPSMVPQHPHVPPKDVALEVTSKKPGGMRWAWVALGLAVASGIVTAVVLANRNDCPGRGELGCISSR